jgi:isoleucyl-tRNA synthetase
MAPYTPFITERVWQDLFRETQPELPDSVHLANWPSESQIDSQLQSHMELARRVTELGRSARATSSVKTRQPLGRALISAPGWSELPAELVDEVAEELNVRELLTLDVSDSDLVNISLKPNFRSLGARFGKQTPLVAAHISQQDPTNLVNALRNGGKVEYEIDGVDGTATIELTDLVITETPVEGWAVAADAGESFALDLEVTHELALAGMARDIVRSLQEGRKNAGLEISDRINVTWSSDNPDVVETMSIHGGEISNEVLALSLTKVSEPVSGYMIVGSESEIDANFGIEKA